MKFYYNPSRSLSILNVSFITKNHWFTYLFKPIKLIQINLNNLFEKTKTELVTEVIYF